MSQLGMYLLALILNTIFNSVDFRSVIAIVTIFYLILFLCTENYLVSLKLSVGSLYKMHLRS